MKLIVGLGNPGKKYENNRHNVGYMVVDAMTRMDNGQWIMDKKLEAKILKSTNFISAKPVTFMNRSGAAVKKLIVNFQLSIDSAYIIHDDLDIPLGQFKIQFGRGPKVHKGINSIEEALGTNEFWRVRVGVDNRNPDKRIPGEEYVLQDFTPKEIKVLEGVFEEIEKELKILTYG